MYVSYRVNTSALVDILFFNYVLLTYGYGDRFYFAISKSENLSNGIRIKPNQTRTNDSVPILLCILKK